MLRNGMEREKPQIKYILKSKSQLQEKEKTKKGTVYVYYLTLQEQEL